MRLLHKSILILSRGVTFFSCGGGPGALAPNLVISLDQSLALPRRLAQPHARLRLHHACMLYTFPHWPHVMNSLEDQICIVNVDVFLSRTSAEAQPRRGHMHMICMYRFEGKCAEEQRRRPARIQDAMPLPLPLAPRALAAAPKHDSIPTQATHSVLGFIRGAWCCRGLYRRNGINSIHPPVRDLLHGCGPLMR